MTIVWPGLWCNIPLEVSRNHIEGKPRGFSGIWVDRNWSYIPSEWGTTERRILINNVRDSVKIRVLVKLVRGALCARGTAWGARAGGGSGTAACDPTARCSARPTPPAGAPARPSPRFLNCEHVDFFNLPWIVQWNISVSAIVTHMDFLKVSSNRLLLVLSAVAVDNIPIV